MIVAIYARKSKITDSGDSIENQINMCKDYINKFSNYAHDSIEFVIYKDEGFSGSNSNRPAFQEMLTNAKQKVFHKLVCYRLDRLSRSVADFASTYEILHQHDVEFISIREQFDTSTPIGRAMLNIAVVFAQLERETITERIRDNMVDLAKTGRWLGGKTPTGFESQSIEYIDAQMNRKKLYQLIPKPSELENVKIIFNKFLEIKSLRGLETYLLQHDIFSKTQRPFTAATLKDILTNPVYACADTALYDYFKNLGSTLPNTRDSFDGTHAVLSYNKTKKVFKDIYRNEQVSKSSQVQSTSPNTWIIAIAKHKSIISSNDWIYIQHLLKENTSRSFYSKGETTLGILCNLIRCKQCGSNMILRRGRISTVTGLQSYAYVCYTKEMSRKQKCDIGNINGRALEQDIIAYITQLAKPNSPMLETLSNQIASNSSYHDELTVNLSSLQEQDSTLQKAISNVMTHFSTFDTSNQTLYAHFLNELDHLSAQQEELRKQMEALKSEFMLTKNKLYEFELVKQAISNFPLLIQKTDIESQRYCMSTIIDKILWDGITAEIYICGQKILSKKLQTFCSNSKRYSYGRGRNSVCHAKQ